LLLKKLKIVKETERKGKERKGKEEVEILHFLAKTNEAFAPPPCKAGRGRR